MLESRAALIAEARGLLDKAEAEDRDATAEESEQFDRITSDADKLMTKITRETKLQEAEKTLGESRGVEAGLQSAADAPGEARTFQLRANICGEERTILIPADDADGLKDFRAYLIGGLREARNLQKSVDAEGGYLSPPIEFMAELIKTIDNATFMREICRVLPPLQDASTLGAPAIDNDIEDAEWTTELLTDGEDSTLDFTRRDMTPYPAAKRIKVSKTLLRRSTMSADAIVRDRMGYKFGVTQEKAFLTGTGSAQPLGVFTASASGIPVGRDVSEDNTTTAFTADGLINAQMFVKQQYRNRALWIMHRDAIKLARKLKDDNGQYIWQPSLIPGTPDMLLGNPVRETEYAPNTFTTGLYVGIFGAFEHYWIVDALTMTIQVLTELYAETNQNGYIGRIETDGAPVVAEAFARVTLA
jgi:HK97 family phage major capsid protein